MERRRGRARKGVGHPDRSARGVLDLEPVHPEEFVCAFVAAVHAETHPGIGGGPGLDVMRIAARPGPGVAGEIGQDNIVGSAIRGDLQNNRINRFKVVAGLVCVGQNSRQGIGEIGGPIDCRRDRIGIGDPQPAVVDLDHAGGGRNGAIALLGPVAGPVARAGIQGIAGRTEIVADGIRHDAARFHRRGDRCAAGHISRIGGQGIGQRHVQLLHRGRIDHVDGIRDDLIVGYTIRIGAFFNDQPRHMHHGFDVGHQQDGRDIIRHPGAVGERVVREVVGIHHEGVERDVARGLRLQHAQEISALVQREWRGA